MSNDIDALSGRLRQLNDEIAATFHDYRRHMSALERELNKVYHAIENDADFGIVAGFDYAKKLQDVLHRRRAVKQEFSRLFPLYQLFSDHYGPTAQSFRDRTETVEKERRKYGRRDVVVNIGNKTEVSAL